VSVRILIAEDQDLVRGALQVLLELEEDFEVVAALDRGDDVLEAIARTNPDVALLDIELPGENGLDVAASIRRSFPSVRVIMVTTFARAGYLQRALNAGAAGFVGKDNPPDELFRSIRRVIEGHLVVDPQLAASALSLGNSPLSARERDLLRAARSGVTTRELARQLALSEGTVRNYLSSAITKTGASTRAEAIRRAEELGWL